MTFQLAAAAFNRLPKRSLVSLLGCGTMRDPVRNALAICNRLSAGLQFRDEPPALWLGIALLILLTGCGRSGPQLAPVTGRVTLDGRPLETAKVLFHPEGNKRPSTGVTDKEGRYQLYYERGIEGATVGPNLVTIAVITDITGGPQLVPPRYNTESEVRVEVEPGKQNVFDFALKSEPK